MKDGYFMNGYPAPYQTAQTFMVAAGNGGGAATSMMWSTDGKTWNASSNSSFINWGYAVAWNGSLWVAAGNGGGTSGGMMWSTDGKTWYAGGSSFASYGNAVAWNGSLWVAAGQGGGAANSMMWSTDGKTWNASSNNAFSTAGYAVAWNGSLWVAGGAGGGAAFNMMWSTDGKTWNASSNSTFATSGTAVAWNGSLWVAAGNANNTAAGSMMWSTDGKTWNASSNPTFPSYGTAVAWNGSLWVAAGSGGATAASNMLWSTDGKTWNASTGNAFSTGGNGVASALPLTTYASGGGGLQIVGGSSNLPTNVTGSLYNASGFSTTLTSVTGTATSNVVQDATVYSFTSGTGGFTVPTGGVIVDYLVVGGGGSGGGGVGGGGGAGGLVYAKGVQLPAGSYTWTVGAGGASVATNTTGNNGSASSLSNAAFGNILALGGGGGGGYASPYTGLPGGSGGGAAGGVSAAYAGGSNATGQGQSGGSAPGLGGGQYGCGGGGAGAAGGANTATAAGAGGNGLAIPITGSNVYYAGGGGGSQQVTPSVPGSLGGLGGGGTGSGQTVYGVTGGAANSGGGGGGASGGTNTAAGGSGVVIIRVYTNIGSRLLIGDGSGYSLALSAQSNAVTTDVMTITDQGNVSIGLTNAVFNGPVPAKFDSIGNLYVADYSGHRVRKITPNGIVTTLVGNGQQSNVIGTGTGASLNTPQALGVVDTAGVGTLYVATLTGNIYQVTLPGGVMTLFSGSNAVGVIDGTTSNTSSYGNNTRELTSDGTYLYVADAGNQNSIRRIALATGIPQTLNSSGAWATNSAGALAKPTILGTAYVNGLALSNTTIYYSANSTGIYSITTGSGTSSTVATGFTTTYAVAIDSAKANLYVTDNSAHVVKRVTIPGAVVTVLAGTGSAGYLDATGSRAVFNTPQGIAIDSAGANLYIPEFGGNKIRKLNLATCNVTTYAGTGTGGFADGSVPTTTFVNNTLLVNSNVGINNNAPAYALDVNGGISTRGGSGQTTTGFINLLSPNPVDTTHTGFVEFWSPNAGTRYSYIGYATSTGMDIYSGVPLRIFGANVAIGASAFTPSYTLDVGVNLANANSGFSISNVGSAGGQLLIGVAQVGGNFVTGSLATDTVIRTMGATQRVLIGTGASGGLATPALILSNGSVGINSTGTSPAYTLDVKGTVRGSNIVGTWSNTTLPITPVSPLCAMNGGDYTMFTAQRPQIEFQYFTAGYNHYIGTRHYAAVGSFASNAIDFYLYNGGTAGTQTASTTPGTGNINVMSVTAAGVGIFNSAPAYTLDVNGTVRGSNYVFSTGSNFFVANGTNTNFLVIPVQGAALVEWMTRPHTGVNQTGTAYATIGAKAFVGSNSFITWAYTYSGTPYVGYTSGAGVTGPSFGNNIGVGVYITWAVMVTCLC